MTDKEIRAFQFLRSRNWCGQLIKQSCIQRGITRSVASYDMFVATKWCDEERSADSVIDFSFTWYDTEEGHHTWSRREDELLSYIYD